MLTYYFLFKSLHIMAVITWMAAMFYLPRLYVYHTKATRGSELDTTLQTMERRLLRIICNPAMIASFVFGLALAYVLGFANLGWWFHAKMLAVILLTVLHVLLAIWRKDFINGANRHSETFYRIINEVPTVLMIIIVLLVVYKPS